MTEKPIMFTANSVRAILDGRKTQTRRVTKPQPEMRDGVYYWPTEADIKAYGVSAGELNQSIFRYAPYQVGDRLWVREKWQHYGWNEDGIPFIQYAADNAKRLIEDIPEDWEERLWNTWADLSAAENYAIDGRAAERKWRSPIFMPRWASRLTPEVTAVRVERVQDVSEKDAIAEGYRYSELHKMHEDAAGMGLMRMPDDPQLWFRTAWDEINGKKHPWSSNPFVWVIEFKREGNNNDGQK